LAPPKAPAPPTAAASPEPEPVRSDGMTDQDWLAALEAWHVDPSTWNVEELGPPPDAPNNIPSEIKARFNDRVRKRAERRREADAAAAKRSAADAELRARLIHATGGNFQPGHGIDDVSPIRAALELVPLDRVVSAIRSKTDRKMFPKNEPATSWREDRLLREIAECYFRSIIQPRLVAAWAAAGKTPATKAPSLPPDAPMPDIDRGRHDDPSAPPGPHVMQPDVALAMPQEDASASEALPAVKVPPEPESAPAVPPENGSASSGDGAAEPDSELPEAPEAAAPPGVVGREQVLAAFKRNGTSPQPAAPQPATPPPRPQERPWFAGERQATPEPEMSDEGWEELIAGFVAGNVAWNTRRLGPEPGNHGCRAPQSVLRRYRLL
jgi:hypothetical protein